MTFEQVKPDESGSVYLSIQYLRGIAAAAIVLKHAAHPGGMLELMLTAGVDLFFVISGFVMVVSTHGRDMTPGQFIGKRCRRILPMWWLTLGFVALIGFGSGGPNEWLQSLLFLPHQTTPDGYPQVYWAVGWTLVFEAIFYALFAAGLALRSQRFILLLLPFLAAFGLIFGRGSNPIINAVLHPMLLEFLMGALVARIVLSGARPSFLWLWAGLLCLGVGASLGWRADIRPLALGLPMAMVVLALAAREVPTNALLRLLGDASYSIYLLHYVPIMLAWQFAGKDAYWPLTAAAGLGVGILAFRYAEKPMLDAMRSQPKLACRFS